MKVNDYQSCRDSCSLRACPRGPKIMKNARSENINLRELDPEGSAGVCYAQNKPEASKAYEMDNYSLPPRKRFSRISALQFFKLT